MTANPLTDLADAAKREADRYRHGEHRPLGAYTGLMTANAAVIGAVAVAFRRTGRRLPPVLSPGDFAVTSLAVHRLARLLAKDTVTSPLRAPFARYDGSGVASELNEKVRGRGVRKAIGELITCPFCVGEWIATAFGMGWLFAPNATRFFATMWGSLAVADALQFARAALVKASEE